MGTSVVAKAQAIFQELTALPEDERIEAINAIRLSLQEYSPFRDEPVDCVLWVAADQVGGNNYNPNTVAPPEMELLQLSIEADGYTQPIVVYREAEQYIVVDGFHRNRIGKEVPHIRTRIKSYLPITIVRSDRGALEERMASTIRHNRARGKHGVQAMSALVLELSRRNWSDTKIAKELGMDPDEVLRMKQITGLAELFASLEFSEAWAAEENGSHE
jgi:ParB-like chromosome segregation protein Spo0J